MGAAASIETRLPVDASDVGSDLATAKAELIRVRSVLGHLAKDYGVESVCYDASDVCYGDDEEEDRVRCVREISHIRQLLCLNTQAASRRAKGRQYPPPQVLDDSKDGGGGVSDRSDSDSDSD